MKYGSKREPIIGTEVFMAIRVLVPSVAALTFICQNWGYNIDFLKVLIGAQVIREDIIFEEEIITVPVDEVLPFIASLSMFAGYSLVALVIIYFLDKLSPLLSDTYKERRRLHKEDRRLSSEYRKKIEILRESTRIADEAITAMQCIHELEEGIKILTAEVRSLRNKRCSCLKPTDLPKEQLDLLAPKETKKPSILSKKPKRKWWEKFKEPKF